MLTGNSIYSIPRTQQAFFVFFPEKRIGCHSYYSRCCACCSYFCNAITGKIADLNMHVRVSYKGAVPSKRCRSYLNYLNDSSHYNYDFFCLFVCLSLYHLGFEFFILCPLVIFNYFLQYSSRKLS